MVEARHAIERLERALAEERELRWAYLFGSAARGGAFRDLDVALMPSLDAYASAVTFGALLERLAHASGQAVDLVDLRSAPLSLVGPLLSERLVLLDREPDARHAWEAQTTSRWLDFKPSLERFSSLRREALRARLGTR